MKALLNCSTLGGLLNIPLRLQRQALAALLCGLTTGAVVAQTPAKKEANTTGRENSPFSRNEADLPKGPAPRTAQSHPDLSGYRSSFGHEVFMWTQRCNRRRYRSQAKTVGRRDRLSSECRRQRSRTIRLLFAPAGLKTLKLRMDAQQRNAQAIARLR